MRHFYIVHVLFDLSPRPHPPLPQIHDEKVKFEVGSRVGSLANVKHRPGGGDKKIFEDKEYMRQISETTVRSSGGPPSLTGSMVGSTSQVERQREKATSWLSYFRPAI